MKSLSLLYTTMTAQPVYLHAPPWWPHFSRVCFNVHSHFYSTPPLWSDSPGLIYVSKVLSLWTAVLILLPEAIPIHAGSGVNDMYNGNTPKSWSMFALLHIMKNFTCTPAQINGFRIKVKSKYDIARLTDSS